MISELKLHAELREKKKSISMRTCSQFPSLRHAAVTQLSRLLVWAAEICPQLIPVLYDASPDESWSLEPSRRSRKWACVLSILQLYVGAFSADGCMSERSRSTITQRSESAANSRVCWHGIWEAACLAGEMTHPYVVFFIQPLLLPPRSSSVICCSQLPGPLAADSSCLALSCRVNRL